MNKRTNGFTNIRFVLILAIAFLLGISSGLAQSIGGQKAINKLGSRLSQIAAAHSKTESELKKLLIEDKTLFVEEKSGSLIYIDEFRKENSSLQENRLVAAPAPFPYTETFRLHSRPGSNRVIYIDFNGHTTANTTWNSTYTGGLPIVSEAFSIDADPTTFSNAEQDAIQSIWQRVSEDFAPFDVDVTTEEPLEDAIIRSNFADDNYGSRAVVSPTLFAGAPGGIAFLGAFNSIGANTKPAFIFSSILGNDEKFIAEAVSHEIGHNLGLSHDGVIINGIGNEYYSGHADWGPIMGLAYTRSVSQWSKGEYFGANNTQDDVAVILTTGLTRITDDYGNDTANAAAIVGSNINVNGVITSQTDVDYFQFATGDGDVTINLNPASVGGNCDLQGTVFDAQGNIVAFIFNQAGLEASRTITLTSGIYYLMVEGVGSTLGTPDLLTGYTDYGSLGKYSVTGSLIPTNLVNPTAVASVTTASGSAPLTVSFSSLGSNDSDGTIVSFNWSFGDGTPNSIDANPVHVYTAAGNYTAILTVTDNSGLVGSSSVSINVALPPNQNPIAIAVADSTTVNAPSDVFFSGGTSFDPDGTITGYSWSFSDGGTTPFPSAFHTYTTPGTYTATLTVTDNRGGIASNTIAVTVLPPLPPSIIYVNNIAMSVTKVGKNATAKAVITVVDGAGRPKSGVNVNIVWSGLTKRNQTAVTAANGTATFTSDKTNKAGRFTITVTGMSFGGFTYTPSRNIMTSASIANP